MTLDRKLIRKLVCMCTVFFEEKNVGGKENKTKFESKIKLEILPENVTNKYQTPNSTETGYTLVTSMTVGQSLRLLFSMKATRKSPPFFD